MAAVLIVEDEAIVALDLSNQIQDLGHKVVGIADNADAAVRLATQHRPELAGAPFEAMGVSLVFHPRNPYHPCTGRRRPRAGHRRGPRQPSARCRGPCLAHGHGAVPHGPGGPPGRGARSRERGATG